MARADAGGTKESAKEKMAQILAENPQVDAVMCGNDRDGTRCTSGSKKRQEKAV